jgi:hypothetical protein
MLVDDQSKASGEPSHKLHSNYMTQEVAANDSVHQKVLVGYNNQYVLFLEFNMYLRNILLHGSSAE